MIKTLFLISAPGPTWDRIVSAQRKLGWILIFHLAPLLLLSSAAEGFGLVKWGKPRGQGSHFFKFSIREAILFEAAQILLSLSVVLYAARIIKSLGETFHGRHSFTQTFTVAAFGLGPLFLLRMLDAFPYVSPWFVWAIGFFLAASLLYYGIPRVMRPDPPHALGLYLMSVLMLAIVTGLVAFVTVWFLQGRFTLLNDLLSNLAGS
jgi:hypothetical protein